jgi:hypothetical protein
MRSAAMARNDDPLEGGWFYRWFYKYLGGPPTVKGAIQGVTQEARDGWKRDLEERKRWSREQKARKAAARRGE